jgi:hypothetical protein
MGKGQSPSSQDGANNGITFMARQHVAGKQNRSLSKHVYFGTPTPYHLELLATVVALGQQQQAWPTNSIIQNLRFGGTPFGCRYNVKAATL